MKVFGARYAHGFTYHEVGLPKSLEHLLLCLQFYESVLNKSFVY